MSELTTYGGEWFCKAGHRHLSGELCHHPLPAEKPNAGDEQGQADPRYHKAFNGLPIPAGAVETANTMLDGYDVIHRGLVDAPQGGLISTALGCCHVAKADHRQCLVTLAAAGDAIAQLRQQLQEAARERDHWKANHDNQVTLKHLLTDRPDLGDRAASVQVLIAARDAALADAGRLSGELATALRSRERLYIGLMAQEVITVGPALLGNICEAGQNELEHRRKLIAEVLEADKADFPPTETDE